MVVGAGPKIGEQANGADCRPRDDLHICVLPQPLGDGYPTDGGLEILTAVVYLPGQQPPDLIEIGLFGSGLSPAQIFDSIAPAA
jgi:hypothetical protein